MAKRFIDTNLFDDPWFMDLSVQAKTMWIYCITKCDHAGILEMNERLCQFQTKIKGLETVIKELGNRLIRVNEVYYFIPKFLEYQYPDFPNSKVRQQASAISILKKFNLFDDNTQTVIKGLVNSYEHEHELGNDNEHEKEPAYKKFYRLEWDKIKDHQEGGKYGVKYSHIIKYIMNIETNVIDEPGEHILNLKKQLSFEQFVRLSKYIEKRQTSIKEMIDSWLNNPKYSKDRISVYAVLQKWSSKAPIIGTNH